MWKISVLIRIYFCFGFETVTVTLMYKHIYVYHFFGIFSKFLADSGPPSYKTPISVLRESRNVFMLNNCGQFFNRCACEFLLTARLVFWKNLPKDISLSRPLIGLQRPKRPRLLLESSSEEQQQVTSIWLDFNSIFQILCQIKSVFWVSKGS